VSKRKLEGADKHQFAIAKRTLQLNDVGVMVLGGMNKEEAREFLEKRAGWSKERIAKFEDAG
jgi:hypothetical protein